jgi:hypothetical protein
MDNSVTPIQILYIGAILTHDNAQNAPVAVLRRVFQSYVFTQQLSERIFLIRTVRRICRLYIHRLLHV